VIDWAKAETNDLCRYGKWLYWAEEWATFKAQTNTEFKEAWKCECRLVLLEQDKVLEELHLRRCPYTSRGPSL
jgi:hypothetical protein